MDYDFDAWQNLAAMRQNALDAAKRETESVNPPSPEPEPEPPVQEQLTIEIPGPVPEETGLPMPEPDSPSGQLPVTVDIPEPEVIPAPEIKKQAVPEKYRNAEWLKTVDDGEENLWKRDDVPHEGWTCEAIYDLGEPVGVCRMCGHQIIRYVHVMSHPAYPRKIGAGCVCAGRMEGDVERARARENAFKNRQARLETFLRTPLKRSRNGNEYMKYKNELITILRDKYREGYYKSVCRNVYSMSFATKEEALKDAFDRLDPPEEI